MEGMLYKWTNYISGWQPRWFVLDGGTLSYYDSQEDAWKGCKGSIKVSVCEIQVHPSDFTRVDLTVPGEQYFYLRAINAAERQKWLVALGTAKACLTDNRTKREKELQENTEALKTKMSELRLYCDLLLQQVNKIKDTSQAEVLNAAAGEDGEAMGTLVKTTCTTFLKTLDECMQIASRTFRADLLSQTPPGSPHVVAIKPHKVRFANQSSHSIAEKKKEPNSDLGNLQTSRRSDCQVEGSDFSSFSPESFKTAEVSPRVGLNEEVRGDLGEVTETHFQAGESAPAFEQPERPAKEGEQDEALSEDEAADRPRSVELISPAQPQDSEVGGPLGREGNVGVNPAEDGAKAEETLQVDTFFSTMGHRFSDIRLEDNNGIPTQAFLDSCYAIVPVLEDPSEVHVGPEQLPDLAGDRHARAEDGGGPGAQLGHGGIALAQARPLVSQGVPLGGGRRTEGHPCGAQQRIWKNPATVPWMGGARSFCSGPQGCPVVLGFHSGAGVPGGG
ncbi:pleckstrin homology domain-containing family A member 8 isoform X2 [Scleropages formosus]|uniref:pleckstrin homology domain-containing family A member 8 isoform X2 n=1 Tax=Scleropages formosus TaxID=113540 RepID=UPI0008788DF2|nr:pleckstrin homology domain-containing family A member 8 isoform X2 [Scleropages formosus]